MTHQQRWPNSMRCEYCIFVKFRMYFSVLHTTRTEINFSLPLPLTKHLLNIAMEIKSFFMQMQLEAMSKNKAENSKKDYLHNFLIAHVNDTNLFPKNWGYKFLSGMKSILNLLRLYKLQRLNIEKHEKNNDVTCIELSA